MNGVVEGIRNSKNVYGSGLTFSNETSTDVIAESVTEKRVLKTAFQFETALKKKLKDTNPVKRKSRKGKTSKVKTKK